MDIDIDFADRELSLAVLKNIRASRIAEGKLVPHNTGVYFQPIPVNPVTALANIDYKIAEERSYFKIDFLNVGIYSEVRNEDHLISLMNTEPLWDLLQQDDFVNLLFHVNGHGSILREMQPTNLEQLAAVLAMIRPAKRYLIGKDWTTVLTEVWVRPETDDYYFKKAHAFSYAAAVIVHMNLICEKLSYNHS